jgi:hypothetical protein
MDKTKRMYQDNIFWLVIVSLFCSYLAMHNDNLWWFIGTAIASFWCSGQIYGYIEYTRSIK